MYLYPTFSLSDSDRHASLLDLFLISSSNFCYALQLCPLAPYSQDILLLLMHWLGCILCFSWWHPLEGKFLIFPLKTVSLRFLPGENWYHCFHVKVKPQISFWFIPACSAAIEHRNYFFWLYQHDSLDHNRHLVISVSMSSTRLITICW